ncbi:MAG: tetratricopeptide repeat protein [Myxococcota bacterium]|nr:tetratricopeptide repeat protein [Myxococcota bacterium]
MEPNDGENESMKWVVRQTIFAACMLLGTACATTSVKQPASGETNTIAAEKSTLPNSSAELHKILDDAADYGPDEGKGLLAIAAATKLFEDNSLTRIHGWKGARAIFLTVIANRKLLNAERANQCDNWSRVSDENKKQVESNLYHALCLGLKAQVFPTQGLGLIKTMLKRAEQVEQLDATFEHSAGARLMGGIYLKAPAWPTSVGDSELAIEHLERAVKNSAEWPENSLLLAEAYYEEDRIEDAQKVLQQVRKQLSSYPDNGWRRHFQKTLEEVASELSDD